MKGYNIISSIDLYIKRQVRKVQTNTTSQDDDDTTTEEKTSDSTDPREKRYKRRKVDYI